MSSGENKSCREVNDYVLGETLGEGGFGRVKLGTHKDTGDKVALKFLVKKKDSKKPDSSTSELRSVKREIEALQKCSHPNVLKLHSVDWNARYPKADGTLQDAVLIVLELAEGGSLFEFLFFSGCFDERVARTYFHQLIDGLKHVHELGIVHRDLKPENILLNKDFKLKIADFGLAHSLVNPDEEKHIMTTDVGTKAYKAPEILRGKPYDESVDIFAAGVILFIMMAGFPPFKVATRHDWWYDCLIRENRALFWKAHERNAYFSTDAKDLINKLLSPDPAKRITIAQIEEHEFFKGHVLSDAELKEDFLLRKEQVDRKKRAEADNRIAGNTLLLDFGDSYVVNRSSFEGKGVDALNDLVSKKESDWIVPELFSEDAVVATYTSFETTQDSLSILSFLFGLLLQAHANPTLDLQQKCGINGKIAPKTAQLAIPTDLLEETGLDALTIEAYRKNSIADTEESAVHFSIRVFQHSSKQDTRVIVLRRVEGSPLTFMRLFDELLGKVQAQSDTK